MHVLHFSMHALHFEKIAFVFEKIPALLQNRALAAVVLTKHPVFTEHPLAFTKQPLAVWDKMTQFREI